MAASYKIKTFTESADQGIVDHIQDKMLEASNIVFLGFSFLENNMELLTVPAEQRGSANTAQLYATSIGISFNDLSIVQNELTVFRGQVQLNTEEIKCVELFREFSRAFTNMLKL